MRRAIFFDRDGIVNIRIVDDYVKDPNDFHFVDGFFDLFKLIKKHNFLAVLVTNQQGIGKELMTSDQLQTVHSYMTQELIANTGSAFDAIYFCGDLASSGSYRRKPNPGMFEEAIAEFGIDPKSSWTIGDSKSDAQAGRKAGTQTILVGLHPNDETADKYFPSIVDVKEYFEKMLN